MDDESLAGRDWVMASIHSRLRRAAREADGAPRRRDATARTSTASATPPAARSTGARPTSSTSSGSARCAVETGTFLEINAQPDRLDLTDTLARAAVEAGVRLVVSTDAHRVHELDNLELAVAQARRGWVSPEQVVNTRSWADVKKLLKRVSDFRADAAATAEWVARYLEGVRELPVLAQVEPGAIRAALPGLAAGAGPSRSRTCCATSTRSSSRASRTGTTRASSPTSPSPGSEPGILAEFLDGGAERERDALAHLAGGDRARGGRARLAAAAARPCPRACTATSRTPPPPPRWPP